MEAGVPGAKERALKRMDTLKESANNLKNIHAVITRASQEEAARGGAGAGVRGEVEGDGGTASRN